MGRNAVCRPPKSRGSIRRSGSCAQPRNRDADAIRGARYNPSGHVFAPPSLTVRFVDFAVHYHKLQSVLVIVNFGCNWDARPGHINLDGSPTVLLAKYLPFPPRFFGRSRSKFVETARALKIGYATAKNLSLPLGSVDGFYASHVLEHLSRSECVGFLSKVRDWLKPEGVLRVVLPDLRLLAEQYLRGDYDANRFIERIDLAGARRNPFSLSKHLWMYDADSFRAILERLGYDSIAASEFAQSSMKELAQLDVPERRDESFYMEARGAINRLSRC